jgi:AcrR family transcriptional regulator
MKRPEANSARRQHVIDVAAETFARLGYHGVSTRQIAENLGIKVSSLYFHLGSKDQALEEICTFGIECSLKSLEAVLENQSDLAGRIHSLFETTADDLLSHSAYMQVYVQEARHLPDDGAARVRAMTDRYARGVRALFREAKERGELQEDISARAAALITIGAIRSGIFFYLEGPIKDLRHYMRTSAEIVHRGMAAR